MALELSHSKIEAVVVIELKGTLVAGKDTELLITTVGDLLEAGETRILLDFGQVKFIDSTGISSVIKTYAAARQKGGTVKLVRLTKRIYDVLQITRLSSVFEIYDDVGKAVASFGVQPAESPPAGTAP